MACVANRFAGDGLGDRRLTAKPKRKPAAKKRPAKPPTKRPAKRKPSIAKKASTRAQPWRKKPPERPPEDASEPSASPGGRPTSFRPEFVEQAKKLCALGATDAVLADFFGVNRSTIHRWQTAESAFRDALKLGKEAADDRVVRSLYERATGYSHEAVKIFLPKDAVEPVLVPYVEHFPPDTTACIFWLKNRDKKNWRDVQEHEHAGKVAVEITDKDRAKALAALMAKLKAKGESNSE